MNTSDWQPTASLEAIRLRAHLYGQIRGFFQHRQVLEVETPVLSKAGNTDPNIDSLQVSDPPGYLQTSPEFAMKRLLAAGSGSIYQLCKAFRKGEAGRRHNPEFTMLEWYRVGFSYHQLMDEVAELLGGVLGEKPVEKLSYRKVFQDQLSIDPHAVTQEELVALVSKHVNYDGFSDAKDTLLDLLMSHVVEPTLGQGGFTFIYDYPATQCALAKVVEDEQGVSVAQRFELYVEGAEIANGYQELTDPKEQQSRFAADNEKRVKAGAQEIPMDRHVIDALQSGLPECAGVALGVDRLLMLMLREDNIHKLISFPNDRA